MNKRCGARQQPEVLAKATESGVQSTSKPIHKQTPQSRLVTQKMRPSESSTRVKYILIVCLLQTPAEAVKAVGVSGARSQAMQVCSLQGLLLHCRLQVSHFHCHQL